MDKSNQVAFKPISNETTWFHSGNGAGRIPEGGSEDRLLEITQALWKKRGTLLRTALLGALSTLIIALFMPNTYRSTTRLMPPDSQGGSGLAALASIASRVSSMDSDMLGGGDLLKTQTKGDLLVGVLHSRTVQQSLVDKFDLQGVYGHPWLRLRTRNEDARKQLERNTEVSEDRKSGIITISVEDHDPKRAAALAKGYVDQLNVLLAQVNTSAARREREFLEQRLTEVKQELDKASRDFSEFSSNKSTFDPKEQGHAMVQAAATLQGELIAAEAQLRGLQTIYTANNVRVRSLQAHVAELRQQLAKFSGSSGPAEENSDNADSDMPFPSLRQLPILGVTYADLYRRAKIEETVFQFLTQQYEAAKVQEAKELPTSKVLDAADVPERKWGPHRGLLAILGGIVGILLGCVGVILSLEWQKRHVDDPYKLLAGEIVGTMRGYRIWRKTEGGVRKVLEMSQYPRSNNNGSETVDHKSSIETGIHKHGD